MNSTAGMDIPNPPAPIKVLWVEDEDYLWELYVMRLGFEVASLVTRTASGFEALRSLQQHHFDLVITDLVHPGPSGYELIRWLRANRPTVPVVVAAGFKGGGWEFRKALSLGATDCISKVDCQFFDRIRAAIANQHGIINGNTKPALISEIHFRPPPSRAQFAIAHLSHNVPANINLERNAIRSALGPDVLFLDGWSDIVETLQATSGPFVLLSEFPEDGAHSCGYWDEVPIASSRCVAEGIGEGVWRQLEWRRPESVTDFFLWLLAEHPELQLQLYTKLSESERPAGSLANNRRIVVHRLNVWGDYVRELAEIARVCLCQAPTEDMKEL